MKKFLGMAIAALFATALMLVPLQAFATDIALTAANVVPASGATLVQGTAGEAVTAGQTVYKKVADAKWYKADCNSATAEVRVASGIAVTGSAAGQPVVVQKGGSLTIGGTLTAGVVYYLSGTAGGIRPVADNTTGDYPQAVGIATSTSVLKLNFGLASGVAL